MNRISTFAASLYGKVRPHTPSFGNPPLPSLFAPGSSAEPLPMLRANQVFPKPLQMRKNMSEEKRLQSLMKRTATLDNATGSADGDGVGHSTFMQRVRLWFVNEGGRRTFFSVWILLHAMVYAFGFLNYLYKDNLNGARATFGITYPIARSAALVLHVDVAMLLLPVCRNFITVIRRSHLNSIIPFDANITFHKAVGWSIVFFSTLHTAAHMNNFARFAKLTKTGFKGFLLANFATGPGATGWVMTVILVVMVWFAMDKQRRKNFERFWYSHHLFILFFILWQFHGMFCMIKPDRPPYCDYWQVGVFWKYFLVSGLIFVYERVLREIRSRHKTYISKVIHHPGEVVEVQIKKARCETRAGQYIFLNCPDVSYWQWHPFTLTSAPQEDYISVHIKLVGNWTKAFGRALGCDVKLKNDGQTLPLENELDEKAKLNAVLPRVMVDGPFGSASEDYHKFEVVMLCAAGIGVTPFASILKSIWYSMNYPQPGRRTRLQKVFFFWVCRDTQSVSWFRSLLAAIEAQDTENRIEIMTYVTQRMKDDDLTNIMVSDVGNEKDTISGLRAPTHYGRPNWDQIFSSVRERHPNTEVGTLFCGPKGLGSTLHKMCNKWSSGEEDGTKFVWGKENF